MFPINIENLKKLKYHIFQKKNVKSFYCLQWNITIEILKTLGLINNTEEYQKIHNHS